MQSGLLRKGILAVLSWAVLSGAGVAEAAYDPATVAEGEKLVKASDCFQCHRVPTKLIGPSYKEVAVKYKGADDAKITELANKVIKGGAGVWGTTPMRAHPTLSVDDAKKMVTWILSLGDAAAATGTTPATTTPGTTTAPATTTPGTTSPTSQAPTSDPTSPVTVPQPGTTQVDTGVVTTTTKVVPTDTGTAVVTTDKLKQGASDQTQTAAAKTTWYDWRRYALNVSAARPFVLASLGQEAPATERTADTGLETETRE